MPIKVLVVDDSGFFRRQITKLLGEDKTLDVIDTAQNGKEAVEKALRLKPDVITMDIEMPEMDGIAATREILRHQHIPILIFSSLTTEGAKVTLDAMDAGAVDFIPKRFEDISLKRDEVRKLLCDKINQIGRHRKSLFTRNIENKRTDSIGGASSQAHSAPQRTASVKATPRCSASTSRTSKYQLLAIGTSTGGPLALQKVLKDLPKDFPLPIVLVQHMPATFTPAFASRLDQVCKISVKEASDGDIMEPGHAYLAPGGMQMTIKKVGSQFKLKVFDGGESLTYRPSVDITFDSLAQAVPRDVLAVVMTGMGADGCKGATKLHAGGSSVWAQDEASSVVWGMPAAVVDAGIAEKILTLDDIGKQIIRAV